jgi:hypothetical protein
VVGAAGDPISEVADNARQKQCPFRQRTPSWKGFVPNTRTGNIRYLNSLHGGIGMADRSVPRYFFDVHDGETVSPDDEGLELDGLNEAQFEAVKTLPELARGVLPNGHAREFVITVRDESGGAVLRAQLNLMVERLYRK